MPFPEPARQRHLRVSPSAWRRTSRRTTCARSSTPCVCRARQPRATLAGPHAARHGPRLPDRGIIMGRSGIRAAYATGRGKIIVRARTEIRELRHDRIRIIVTELPYQVNKRRLIENIAEQVKDKRSRASPTCATSPDRTGMRIVIELKKDANPQVVLNQLFRRRSCRPPSPSSCWRWSITSAAEDPVPEATFSTSISTSRKRSSRRRTQFDLKKAQERAHLLEGSAHGRTTSTRSSASSAPATTTPRRETVMDTLRLSTMCRRRPLSICASGRCTASSRKSSRTSMTSCEKRIAYFETSGQRRERQGVLKDDLIAIRDKYGDERRTDIERRRRGRHRGPDPEETCVFTLTHNGYIKRTTRTPTGTAPRRHAASRA